MFVSFSYLLPHKPRAFLFTPPGKDGQIQLIDHRCKSVIFRPQLQNNTKLQLQLSTAGSSEIAVEFKRKWGSFCLTACPGNSFPATVSNATYATTVMHRTQAHTTTFPFEQEHACHSPSQRIENCCTSAASADALHHEVPFIPKLVWICRSCNNPDGGSLM